MCTCSRWSLFLSFSHFVAPFSTITKPSTCNSGESIQYLADIMRTWLCFAGLWPSITKLSNENIWALHHERETAQCGPIFRVQAWFYFYVDSHVKLQNNRTYWSTIIRAFILIKEFKSPWTCLEIMTKFDILDLTNVFLSLHISSYRRRCFFFYRCHSFSHEKEFIVLVWGRDDYWPSWHFRRAFWT